MIPYCTNITDPKTGVIIIHDYECDLEYVVTPADESLELEVTAVWVNGVDLLKGDALSVLLGNRLAAKAQVNFRYGDYPFDKIVAQDGWVLKLGHEPGDGRWYRE